MAAAEHQQRLQRRILQPEAGQHRRPQRLRRMVEGQAQLSQADHGLPGNLR
jgi:hypothetical protein